MILISFGSRRNLMIQEMDNEAYALCKLAANVILEDFYDGGRLRTQML